MTTLITPRPMKSLPAGTQGAGLVARIGTGFWRVLEEVGQTRANRELMALAARYETNQPDLAKQLRAACAHSR
ncbi:MAG: hypothetical protein ABI433_15090 [Burkholderiaceae bacterium]